MCFITLAVIGGMSVQAATEPPVSPAVTIEEQVEPRADIIETYYRKTPEGKLQYRHWNSTKGRWVEPDWVDA